MKILDLVQGTLEWKQARVGVPSASQFKNIVTTDGKLSKTRTKYLYQLAGERITGNRDEIFQNAAMARGIKLEAEARDYFTMITGIEVNQVGMCLHDSGLFSCSPDGLIAEEKGLEIKCPSMAVHIEYLRGNKVPSDYYQQVHGSMLTTGHKEWFFMSYYPGLKHFIHLEKRDDSFCEALEKELVKFSSDLESLVDELKQ